MLSLISLSTLGFLTLLNLALLSVLITVAIAEVLLGLIFKKKAKKA
jgi:hypothetical protein